MNTKRDPKLFIGPWIGEFGVELLRWQSIARTLAQSRKWSEIIVATHPDRFFLYNDFATKFVPYRPNTIHTVGFSCVGHRGETIHEKYIDQKQGDVWLNPKISDNAVPIYHPVSASRGTFRNFAEGLSAPKKKYDLLIHARATPKANQKFKNWPTTHYNALIEALPRQMKIASIGAVDGAHKLKGTDDLRGISLAELATYCKSAKLMIGPSSGTIHFGMHCGLPVVTWLQEDERYNYFPHWNPFDVPLCCMPGWQPAPGVVMQKTLEMLRLIGSRAQPIEMIVVGSKRSGHHAIIEWITRLMPEKRITLWNDCSCRGIVSYPDENCVLPSRMALPKMLHHPAAVDTTFEWNTQGRHGVRFLSFEGASLPALSMLPEAKQAKRIVVIIRDIANTVASLKKGILALQNKSFLHPDFERLMSGALDYLREAVGETRWMEKYASKTIFISYNRWHLDRSYRREIAAALGFGKREVERGVMSSYTFGSSFQDTGTSAQLLDTNNRWPHFAGDRRFWNLVCDNQTHELECKFHGSAMPSYAELPL